MRVPGEDAFAITPSSYDYAKMEPADIWVLGLEGRHILGAKKTSIERRCTRQCTDGART